MSEVLGRIKDSKLAKTVAGALVVGTLFAGCGNPGKKISVSEARQSALFHYDKTFQLASPAGKFVLQYLRSSNVVIDKYQGAQDGLFSKDHTDNVYDFHVNNGCLENTAYDIAGGAVKGSVSGFLVSGSVNGNIPTAAAFAEINPQNPDQLIVKSGHTNSVDLHFNGLKQGQTLAPSDNQTSNVLNTYGCETGVISMEHFTAGDSNIPDSSDWIK